MQQLVEAAAGTVLGDKRECRWHRAHRDELQHVGVRREAQHRKHFAPELEQELLRWRW
jgi:hypothetical protein